MSRDSLASKESYQVSEEAFAFLGRCPNATYDMTSAGPLFPPSTGIMPPQKIIQMMRKVDFNDLTSVRGVSRGELETLNKCTQFFRERGISCNLEHVSLNENILSAIEEVLIALKARGSNKVLIPTPTFGFYLNLMRQRGMEYEFLPTNQEEGFLPNPQELEQKIIESGAKILLLCYPNNPTGSIMTQECAQAIADISERHGVFVISDEAFMSNFLSDKKHFPVAAIDGMIERSFTVTGPAKSMLIGIKRSFCVGQKDIVSMFARLGGYPTKRDQKIMAASIESSDENKEYFELCRKYYLENIEIVRDKVFQLNQRLNSQFGSEDISYVKPVTDNPDATNVYLLDFSGLFGKTRGGEIMRTGLDVSKWLLEDASVGSVPGECSFFNPEKMIVRFTLNNPHQEMTQAFDNIIEAASRITSPLATIENLSGSRLVGNNENLSINK